MVRLKLLKNFTHLMIPLPNKCSCCETDATFGGLLGQRRFLFDLHHPASVTQIQSYLLMSSKQY